MNERPPFEADDTATTYSPPRAARRHRVALGRGRATEGRDPVSGAAPDGRPAAPVPKREPIAIGLAAMAIAVVATIMVLDGGGWIRDPSMEDGYPVPATAAPRPLATHEPPAPAIRAREAPEVVTIVARRDGDRASVLGDGPSTIASGIVFDETGLVLTSRSVVCTASAVSVLLGDGRRLPGRIYGLDSLTDLAVVEIDAARLPSADIGDSTSLRPGQPALMVGGAVEDRPAVARQGSIRAIGRTLVVDDPCDPAGPRAIRDLIAIDGSMGDAGPGSAVVDAMGSVVGIGTVWPEPAGASYAIPIDIARPVMEQAVAGRPLSRPSMGINFTVLDASVAKAHGLVIDHGAWLRDPGDDGMPAVVPGGPADIAGLREGDILTAIDDQRIDAGNSLDTILSGYRPEDQDPVEVWILRDGIPSEIHLTLGSQSTGT